MSLDAANGIPIVLASEDLLSELVLERLLTESASSFHVMNRLRRGGNGYLKENVVAWNRTLVKGIPLLMLTDLDSEACAPKLVGDWLLGNRLHPNLIFRVAVREVEAWLIADRHRFAEYLGVAASRIPIDPDGEADPKRAVFNAAKKSRRRDIREGIPPFGSGNIGPEYNLIMSNFVLTNWNPREAADRSDSLARALHVIDAFSRQ